MANKDVKNPHAMGIPNGTALYRAPSSRTPCWDRDRDKTPPAVIRGQGLPALRGPTQI